MKLFKPFLLAPLIAAMWMSCGPKEENASVTELDISEIVRQDTVITSVPIRIGNETGTVKIQGIRKYIMDEIVESYFIVELQDLPSHSLQRKLNKEIIIDDNTSVLFKDSTLSDFTDNAVVNNIEYASVRGNTLYFNATLLNQMYKKEINGRFNIFYATEKKGTVYGWITDEVK